MDEVLDSIARDGLEGRERSIVLELTELVEADDAQHSIAMHAGVLNVLFQLCQCEQEKIQKAAAFVVFSVAWKPSLEEAASLVTSGMMHALCVFAQHSDVEVKRIAANVLPLAGSIRLFDAELARRFVNDGGLTALVSLAQSRDAEVQSVVANHLFALLRCEHFVPFVVEERGLVDTVCAFLESGVATRLCSGIEATRLLLQHGVFVGLMTEDNSDFANAFLAAASSRLLLDSARINVCRVTSLLLGAVSPSAEIVQRLASIISRFVDESVQSESTALQRESELLLAQLGIFPSDDVTSDAPFGRLWRWVATEGSPAPAALRPAVCCVNGDLYIHGGLSIEGLSPILHNTVHVLNKSNAWSQIEFAGSQPSGRYGHSMTFLDNVIWMFGGETSEGVSNELWALDVRSHKWGMPQVKGTWPSARLGHSATPIGSNIYVFGGSARDGPSDDVFVFDTVKLEWSLLSTSGLAPSPRHAHTAEHLEGCLFVYGGSAVQDPAWHRLNIEQMCWTTCGKTGGPPTGRVNHGSTLLHDQYLLVFLGSEGRKNGKVGRLSRSMYVFDAHLDEWLPVVVLDRESAISARANFCCVATVRNGSPGVYVWGGEDVNGPRADLHVLKTEMLTARVHEHFSRKTRLRSLPAEVFEAASSGCLEDFYAAEKEGVNVTTLRQDGMSLLHVACLNGHSEIASHLLDLGTSIHVITDHGRTPLDIACATRREHTEGSNEDNLVAMLLQAGAAVNVDSTVAAPPLHHAACAGNVSAVNLLLCAGARPGAKDVNLLTAYEAATKVIADEGNSDAHRADCQTCCDLIEEAHQKIVQDKLEKEAKAKELREIEQLEELERIKREEEKDAEFIRRQNEKEQQRQERRALKEQQFQEKLEEQRRVREEEERRAKMEADKAEDEKRRRIEKENRVRDDRDTQAFRRKAAEDEKRQKAVRAEKAALKAAEEALARQDVQRAQEDERRRKRMERNLKQRERKRELAQQQLLKSASTSPPDKHKSQPGGRAPQQPSGNVPARRKSQPSKDTARHGEGSAPRGEKKRVKETVSRGGTIAAQGSKGTNDRSRSKSNQSGSRCLKCHLYGHYAKACPEWQKAKSADEQKHASGPRCMKCRLPGHYAKACPEWKINKDAPKPSKRADADPLCLKCQLPGHYARDCPEWKESKDVPKTNKQATGPLCMKCQLRGHYARACPEWKKDLPKANQQRQESCVKCGLGDHRARECPDKSEFAATEACTRCGRDGHKASACPSHKEKPQLRGVRGLPPPKTADNNVRNEPNNPVRKRPRGGKRVQAKRRRQQAAEAASIG